jgi:hypothetical protein
MDDECQDVKLDVAEYIKYHIEEAKQLLIEKITGVDQKQTLRSDYIERGISKEEMNQFIKKTEAQLLINDAISNLSLQVKGLYALVVALILLFVTEYIKRG